MPRIEEPLKKAISERASDIHISTGEPIRMRIDGDLEIIYPEPLSDEAVIAMLFEILSEDEKKRFVTNKNLDRSIHLANGHFRLNIFYTRRGPAAVLRTIPRIIPTMSELGLPTAITKLTELPKGLVLVTGPTGSGKSTTLAAMLHHINLNYKCHILTVEDPVEFVHESKKSLVNQREIGSSCPTFADALKYALREDPDVILVGEMRDLETIALALTAAETGHLVFATLHTRGAAASVDRIIDSFPANQQAMIRTMLSESLAGVISQCLIRKATGRGRVAAYEILLVNTAIANLIREGKTFQMPSIMQTSRKEGMVLMDQSILDLYRKKLVKAEDAAACLEDPAILEIIKKNTIPITEKSNPSINPSAMTMVQKPPIPITKGTPKTPQTLPPQISSAPPQVPKSTMAPAPAGTKATPSENNSLDEDLPFLETELPEIQAATTTTVESCDELSLGSLPEDSENSLGSLTPSIEKMSEEILNVPDKLNEADALSETSSQLIPDVATLAPPSRRANAPDKLSGQPGKASPPPPSAATLQPNPPAKPNPPVKVAGHPPAKSAASPVGSTTNSTAKLPLPPAPKSGPPKPGPPPQKKAS